MGRRREINSGRGRGRVGVGSGSRARFLTMLQEAAIDVIRGSCSATLIGSTHRTGLAWVSRPTVRLDTGASMFQAGPLN
jgi:hypothetical protein